MDKNVMNNKEILNYLSEYLIMALDELTDTNAGSEFVNGEITAFVECLEIIMSNSGCDRKELLKIEKKYQIA